MQSEPNTVSSKALDTHDSPSHSPSIQHGFSSQQPPDLSLPLAEGSYGPRSRSVSSVAAGSSPSSSSDASSSPDVGALSVSPSSSPALGSRITSYEKGADTHRRRQKYNSLGFQVVTKPRKPGDHRSSIAGLPNEILTHALSYLPPADLISVSLVSRQLHEIVTSPHAWQAAFTRFFPAHRSLDATVEESDSDNDGEEASRMEKPSFTRVTPSARWRGEYVIRTQLLRSLARGKPQRLLAPPSASRGGQQHTANPMTNYYSGIPDGVRHLHASWGIGLNKRAPKCIHGGIDRGMATTSDPAAGRTDVWGLTDPHPFMHFENLYPGEAFYGLGAGEVVGGPNVMDISIHFGMIYGENAPGGFAYHRGVDEMRGRELLKPCSESQAELGIPWVDERMESICVVWISKSQSLPSLSEGMIGLMTGSSSGIVSSYTLAQENRGQKRLPRAQVTARWVLSPGVPIVALAIDEHFSLRRHAQNRIWAVALNALGELFYLTKLPRPVSFDKGGKLSNEDLDRQAWKAGRTVYWNLIEPSRRQPRANHYERNAVDGSYSPRSSWNGMCLSTEQIQSETQEIEKYMAKRPHEFQKACEGWDMQRKLEVDFAGDDGNLAGEAVVVITCGVNEDTATSLRRYVRFKYQEIRTAPDLTTVATPSLTSSLSTVEEPSVSSGMGAGSTETDLKTTKPPIEEWARRGSDATTIQAANIEEWRTTDLALADLKAFVITASAVDQSTFAVLTTSEDPVLSTSAASDTSSSLSTPASIDDAIISAPEKLPGQRARLLAVGTNTGSVLAWDIRASAPKAVAITNTLSPVRIIHTDSPEISCLALTALQIVHGGNDGLVQAWDPLASINSPVRTLHSRYSTRARRRLLQALASAQGVGINLYAAGAICLDPDPTSLRGMVGLGQYMRYWSYSSSAADAHKSTKRKLRRSERNSNNGTPFNGYSTVNRSGNLKGFIAAEQWELKRDEEQDRKEKARLEGRFGTNLLGAGATDQEALMYAKMLSEESLAQDQERQAASLADSPRSLGVTESGAHDEDMDDDLKEAIRQSLAATSSSPLTSLSARPGHVDHSEDTPALPNVAFRYKAQPASRGATPHQAPDAASSSRRAQEDSDLAYALELSRAEEDSRLLARGGSPETPVDQSSLHDAWPGLSSASASPRRNSGDSEAAIKGNKGKSKGKGKAVW